MPSDVTADVSVFDRFAGAAAGFFSKPWFFSLCVLLVLVWAPSYTVIHNVDTWQLIINTATTIITAPELLRSWLSLDAGASIAVIERLMVQDTSVVGLSVSYVPITADQHANVGATCKDVIAFLEEDLGVSIGECGTIVSAAACDPETAKLLEVPEGAPIIWLEDLIQDADGRIRAIHQLRYRGDRVAFSAIARRGSLQYAG